MIEYKSKLPNVGESIFAVMSRLANETKSINLSQGFPGFNCSEELINLVDKYNRLGFTQYAPMPGVPVFRERIAEKIDTFYHRKLNHETEITITAGATQALFTAINAIVDIGDEVIMFEPAYDSYCPSVLLNGGIPVSIRLNEDDNFSIDWNEVKARVNNKTKLIIINSPHNPSGAILKDSDIQSLIEISRMGNFLILSDEVYEYIVFDYAKHLSLHFYEELRERTLIVSSFGKTFHATGWKVGYVAGPANLISEFRKIHQFTVFAVNTPVQYAYAEYMKNDKPITSLNGFYQQKRDYFNGFFAGSSYKIKPAEGTYFQLLDFTSVSQKTDYDFALDLAKNAGVAVIPLSPFYSDGKASKFVRICFAKNENVLKEGAIKIINYAKT